MTPEEFWNQDDRHKDQKFYAGFCLLESALGDYAVARDLHQHDKLNWASTAYYYSMVHALRLLCFVAKGDFLTGHEKLARLYRDNCLHSLRDKDLWLHHFIRNSRADDTINLITLRREDITEYFVGGQTPPLPDEKLKRWGEILDKARECRNDSNYEGLIIAHGYRHCRVTDDFNKLANILCKASEDILPEVVSLFNRFAENNQRRAYWYAYLNWKARGEGLYYLEDSLRSRLLGINNARQLKGPNQAVMEDPPLTETT